VRPFIVGNQIVAEPNVDLELREETRSDRAVKKRHPAFARAMLSSVSQATDGTAVNVNR
jgi:hypothetical protein